MVVTNELRLATYVDLDRHCNMDDLHNMLEIIEAKEQFDIVAHDRQQHKANQ